MEGGEWTMGGGGAKEVEVEEGANWIPYFSSLLCT